MPYQSLAVDYHLPVFLQDTKWVYLGVGEIHARGQGVCSMAPWYSYCRKSPPRLDCISHLLSRDAVYPVRPQTS